MRMLTTMLAAMMFLIGTVANAAMSARDGDLFFRYRGGPTGTAAVNPVTPYDADVTARFVGLTGFAFSEKIPLVPGKTVKRWEVVDGVVPAGISFDGATGKFSGTPSTPQRGLEAFVQGYGDNGRGNAIARVTFDIFTAQDQAVTVDFYGHTNTYRFLQLPLPSGVVVDHWNIIFSPPPGVNVIGRNFDGTPSAAGRYPIAVQGYDYLDREIILFTGYYTVEDGPTFPEVADDVRPIDPDLGVQFFNVTVPTLRTVATNPTEMLYEVELEDGETLPGTVRVLDPIGTMTGDVYFPYDTAKVRWKATDVDGTIGYSNWFTFGTSYPSPKFTAATLGPFYAVVGTPYDLSLDTAGTAGDKHFSLLQGTLPKGLALDPVTGHISGTPELKEVQDGLKVGLDVTNGGNVDSAQSAPFKIIVDPAEVSLRITLK